MNRGPTAPIVVAIDVARPAENVVEWAAAEAATQGSPLRIVHAIAPEFCLDPSMASAMFEYAAGSRAAAALLLRDAVTRATSVASELNVSATLLNGTVTWALRREARTARLLVVGHHHTRNGGLRGLLARSVAGELAAHAPCPVVVVRHQDGPVAGAARVVVGVNRRLTEPAPPRRRTAGVDQPGCAGPRHVPARGRRSRSRHDRTLQLAAKRLAPPTTSATALTTSRLA